MKLNVETFFSKYIADPWAQELSLGEKVLSTVSVIALTILTLGFIFPITSSLRDRNITKIDPLKKGPPIKVIRNIAQKEMGTDKNQVPGRPTPPPIYTPPIMPSYTPPMPSRNLEESIPEEPLKNKVSPIPIVPIDAPPAIPFSMDDRGFPFTKPFTVPKREEIRTDFRGTQDVFVGTEALKKQLQDHLSVLKAFAKNGEWEHLSAHSNNFYSGFDWWMFPIDRGSAGQGDRYKLSPSNIETLKRDPEFMNSYREGVRLVLNSWGWDPVNNRDISNDKQQWTGYQVRLGKMIHSLILFRQEDLFLSVLQFCKANKIEGNLEGWIQQKIREGIAQFSH